jgi:hypothetical protein
MPQANHDGKPLFGDFRLQKTEEATEAGGRDGSLPRRAVSGASLANFILGKSMAKQRMWVGRWLALAIAGMCALTEPVLAQSAAPADRQPRVVQLQADGARLRSDLERTNAEVSALKRSGPGVRNEYRLRRKQADAEALARKLTAVEAELRRLRGQVAPPVAPAAMEAAEAPAALEARADLLSDEARRLTQQASGLSATAGELRSRRTLLRRGGQIERDPFASMDGSKRFMVLQGTRTLSGSPERGTGGSGAPQPPPPPAPVPVNGPPPPTAGTFAGSSSPTAVPTDNRNAAVAPTRALLDPAALAERRRTEPAAGKPASEIERLERAAADLTGRARALEAEARALRERAARR